VISLDFAGVFPFSSFFSWRVAIFPRTWSRPRRSLWVALFGKYSSFSPPLFSVPIGDKRGSDLLRFLIHVVLLFSCVKGGGTGISPLLFFLFHEEKWDAALFEGRGFPFFLGDGAFTFPFRGSSPSHAGKG